MCEFVNSAGLKCKSEKERHPVHHGFDFSGPTPVPWEEPNLDWVEKPPTPDDAAMKAKLKEMTRAVRENRRELGKNVGDDDPMNSHVAAERFEPKRGTRNAQVLEVLLAADGGWIDGNSIATEAVGGAEGRRRARDLRKLGWPVICEPDPASETAWRYRMDMEALNVAVAAEGPPEPVMRNFD